MMSGEVSGQDSERVIPPTAINVLVKIALLEQEFEDQQIADSPGLTAAQEKMAEASAVVTDINSRQTQRKKDIQSWRQLLVDRLSEDDESLDPITAASLRIAGGNSCEARNIVHEFQALNEHLQEPGTPFLCRNIHDTTLALSSGEVVSAPELSHEAHRADWKVRIPATQAATIKANNSTVEAYLIQDETESVDIALSAALHPSVGNSGNYIYGMTQPARLFIGTPAVSQFVEQNLDNSYMRCGRYDYRLGEDPGFALWVAAKSIGCEDLAQYKYLESLTAKWRELTWKEAEYSLTTALGFSDRGYSLAFMRRALQAFEPTTEDWQRLQQEVVDKYRNFTGVDENYKYELLKVHLKHGLGVDVPVTS